MGKTLRNMVREFLTVKGADSYDLLAKKAGVSSMTIRRWIKKSALDSNSAFRLAKALGCEKEEAIRLANEPPVMSADSA